MHEYTLKSAQQFTELPVLYFSVPYPLKSLMKFNYIQKKAEVRKEGRRVSETSQRDK